MNADDRPVDGGRRSMVAGGRWWQAVDGGRRAFFARTAAVALASGVASVPEKLELSWSP